MALYTGNSGASKRVDSILRCRFEALVRGNERRVIEFRETSGKGRGWFWAGSTEVGDRVSGRAGGAGKSRSVWWCQAHKLLDSRNQINPQNHAVILERNNRGVGRGGGCWDVEAMGVIFVVEIIASGRVALEFKFCWTGAVSCHVADEWGSKRCITLMRVF
jgi:hypothetical protein